MGWNSFGYNVLLTVHLIAVVVGFGTAFAWTILGAKARRGLDDGGATLSKVGLNGLATMSAPAIWVVGVTGLLLVALPIITDSARIYSFADTWISTAFLLFFIAAGVTQFLWIPAQRKVDTTIAELSAMPAGSSRPTAKLATLEEQGKQVAVWGGLVHLSFALSMLVMVFKPGM